MNSINILEIQSAIDCCEKAFPRKASSSAAEALIWQAGSGMVLRNQNALGKIARQIHDIFETRVR